MQLSTWNEQQLVSLARVYIKHRQFDRSELVRSELQARAQASGATHLITILDELQGLKPEPLVSEIRSLFSMRQAA